MAVRSFTFSVVQPARDRVAVGFLRCPDARLAVAAVGRRRRVGTYGRGTKRGKEKGVSVIGSPLGLRVWELGSSGRRDPAVRLLWMVLELEG